VSDQLTNQSNHHDAIFSFLKTMHFSCSKNPNKISSFWIDFHYSASVLMVFLCVNIETLKINKTSLTKTMVQLKYRDYVLYIESFLECDRASNFE